MIQLLDSAAHPTQRPRPLCFYDLSVIECDHVDFSDAVGRPVSIFPNLDDVKHPTTLEYCYATPKYSVVIPNLKLLLVPQPGLRVTLMIVLGVVYSCG